MYPNYQALPDLRANGVGSTDYGSSSPNVNQISAMVLSLLGPLGQTGFASAPYSGYGGYGGYGGGPAQASAGVSSYLGSPQMGYGSPTWMPSPNPVNGFGAYNVIMGGAAQGYDPRQSVFQPCQGNIQGYGSYAQSYMGNTQPFAPSHLPGYPSGGYCPPPVCYGGGQAMGGQQCGYGNFPPYKITITFEPQPRPVAPHCPPPPCPPPPPPVAHCPPPPPPPVVDHCPPPPPPPVENCPPPVVAPPPPPVVPRVETPPADPRQPITYTPVGEGGSAGWASLSEAVKNRLVGGDESRRDQISFKGQSPDIYDNNRAERLSVWHTLQADPRLRYDVDSHNFFITSQTGQKSNVLSIDSECVQNLSGGGAGLVSFDQIRSLTSQAVSQLGGNANIAVAAPTSGVGEGPVAANPAGTDPFPTPTIQGLFPNAPRLFG